MNLRTRPYTYLETSQLDLDSLVLYTTSITVDVSNIYKNNEFKKAVGIRAGTKVEIYPSNLR